MGRSPDKSQMAVLRHEAYGSYLVVHPDGNPMFRCTADKAWWYLSRDLATILGEEDGVTRVQLKFTPKGKGHHGDEFYLGRRENKCVVCGEHRNLTRHHIVPHNYRRAMPVEGKSRNYHDVVLLCDPCHRVYEEQALRVKEELSARYDAPISGRGDKFDYKLHQVKKAASALVMFGKQMPAHAVDAKRREIADYLGHEPSEQEVNDLSAALVHDMTEHKRHGEIVISQTPDLQAFVEMWRTHFITCMSPKYMPQHWDIKRKWNDVGPHRENVAFAEMLPPQ